MGRDPIITVESRKDFFHHDNRLCYLQLKIKALFLSRKKVYQEYIFLTPYTYICECIVYMCECVCLSVRVSTVLVLSSVASTGMQAIVNNVNNTTNEKITQRIIESKLNSLKFFVSSIKRKAFLSIISVAVTRL